MTPFDVAKDNETALLLWYGEDSETTAPYISLKRGSRTGSRKPSAPLDSIQEQQTLALQTRIITYLPEDLQQEAAEVRAALKRFRAAVIKGNG
jgi:hypothetical protein